MNTFKINDRVMYMSKKIYKIANIEEKDFGFGPQKYFVLVDEKTNNDILYLPTDNETALKNIRHLLTKKEIDQIEENTLNKIEKGLKANDREYNMDEIKAKINGTNKRQEIIKSIYDKLNSLPEQEVEQTYELIQEAQKIGPKGLGQVTKILKEHNESKEEKAKANEKNDQEQER